MTKNEETKETDVMPLEANELVEIARGAEEAVEAVKKIITMALKVTSEKHWVNQAGRPYLQGDGAEGVANLFGISWNFIEKPYKVNEEDGNYRYECLLNVRFKARSIEVIGARSTKDTFFRTRYKYNQSTQKKEKYTLPISEVDSADVLKSCITNAIGNGVTRILGIRNATWEMLKEAGLNVDKIQKISYGKDDKKKGAQAGTQGATTTMKDPDAPATEPQQKAIHAMLGKLDNKDEYTKHTEVSNVLGLKDIITSMGDITKKQASTVIEHLQAELDKQK